MRVLQGSAKTSNRSGRNEKEKENEKKDDNNQQVSAKYKSNSNNISTNSFSNFSQKRSIHTNSKINTRTKTRYTIVINKKKMLKN